MKITAMHFQQTAMLGSDIANHSSHICSDHCPICCVVVNAINSDCPYPILLEFANALFSAFYSAAIS
jgi:hypothetical protein